MEGSPLAPRTAAGSSRSERSAWTRWRVAVETSWLPLRTLEMVEAATPASRAISFIVTRFRDVVVTVILISAKITQAGRPDSRPWLTVYE